MTPEQKRINQAKKQAVYYRNYRRARDRALVRLAQANPAQYDVFLKEERQRDEQDGKTWRTLAGVESSPIVYSSVDDAPNPFPDWTVEDHTGEPFINPLARIEYESGASDGGSIRVEG